MFRSAQVPSSNRPPPTQSANRLLGALPAKDYARLLPTLDIVPTKLKDLLHGAGDPLERVYFNQPLSVGYPTVRNQPFR
jgi:hypothetical protein